ncbi:hypothetical protein [Candidatus Deianiraea vastatrix]|uniref:Lipoprotein n=1 Tax=Candidatus Deianiraea vastatrix TaxID=2163644 RepID=A0A5B8XEK1_9RICK|nr:hypothetical protein [Candidatus Deianiraea vastatrix]QED23738.1 hypothetical protein Deia_00951 [Candidatus Deianiraea vastatrix]
MNKISYFKILICTLCLTSCAKFYNSASNLSANSCQILLNQSIFENRVSDSYNDKIIKDTIEYEKSQANQNQAEIVFLLEKIKAKQISDDEKKLLRIEINERMKREIEYYKAFLQYFSSNDSAVYKNSTSLIEGVIEDMEIARSIFNQNYKSILSGEMPSRYNMSGDSIFFCNANKKQILGKRDINAMMHIALNIVSEIYKLNIDGILMNGEKYITESSILKQIPLPRKFSTTDSYTKGKSSFYLVKKNLSTSSLIVPTTGHDGANELIKIKYQNQQKGKNLPFYANIFKLNQDITPEFIIWSYRMFFKEGYIPAIFLTKLGSYDEFMDKFKPIKIKSIAKSIKPGQLIVISRSIKTDCRLESVVNYGNDHIVGIVMDYDINNKDILILTEYGLIKKLDKIGLGYDSISEISSGIIDQKIYLFEPIRENLIAKDNNEEKKIDIDSASDDVVDNAKASNVETKTQVPSNSSKDLAPSKDTKTEKELTTSRKLLINQK